MRQKYFVRVASICMAILMAFTPITASAALLRRGSRGNEVKELQMTLKELGYFTYPKATGYFGSITEKAVKKFQKDQKLATDGIVGKRTRGALKEEIEDMVSTMSISSLEQTNKEDIISTSKTEVVKKTELKESNKAKDNSEKANQKKDNSKDTNTKKEKKKTVDKSKIGALDWYKDVRYIWKRGEDAKVTDVETGKSFMLRRTYGTNHADVEPLTKKDTKIIKSIWGKWSWERRAVVVEIDGYILAGSLTAMPHAGVDSKPAVKVVNNRSGGYGRGQNLDAVKGNGISGVMDLHFKNSRTHNTNEVRASQQKMVRKAAKFIEKNYLN